MFPFETFNWFWKSYFPSFCVPLKKSRKENSANRGRYLDSYRRKKIDDKSVLRERCGGKPPKMCSVGWWIILLCWKLAWFGNRWRWYFVICDFYKFWQFDISCSRNPRPHSLNRTKPKPVASPPFAFKTCLRTFLSKRDLLREKKQ